MFNEALIIPFISLVENEDNKQMITLNPTSKEFLSESTSKKFKIVLLFGDDQIKQLNLIRVLEEKEQFNFEEENQTKSCCKLVKKAFKNGNEDFGTLYFLMSSQQENILVEAILLFFIINSSLILATDDGLFINKNDFGSDKSVMDNILLKMTSKSTESYLMLPDLWLYQLEDPSKSIPLIQSNVQTSDLESKFSKIFKSIELKKSEDQNLEESSVSNASSISRIDTISSILRFSPKSQATSSKLIKSEKKILKILSGKFLLESSTKLIDTFDNHNEFSFDTITKSLIFEDQRNLLSFAEDFFLKKFNIEQFKTHAFEDEELIKNQAIFQIEFIKLMEEFSNELSVPEKSSEIINISILKAADNLKFQMKLNSKASHHLSKKMIADYLDSYPIPIVNNLEDANCSIFQNQKENLNKFYSTFKKKIKSSSKYEMYAEMIPNFLINYYEIFSSSLLSLVSEKIQLLDKTLSSNKHLEESITKLVDENMRLRLRLKNEHDQTPNENINKDILSNLENALAKKKLKSKELKKTNEEMIKSLEELKLKIQSLEKSELLLKEKNNDLELRIKFVFSRLDSEFQSQMKIFQSNLTENLKHSILDREDLSSNAREADLKLYGLNRLDAKADNISREEFNSMKIEIESNLNKIWDESVENKNKLQNFIHSSEEKLTALNNHIRELENEKILYKETINGLEEKIKIFETNNALLQDEVKTQASELKNHQETIELLNKKTVKLLVKIQELEAKIGELKSNEAQLRGINMDILFFSREALKKALKQKHTLRQALESMDPSISIEARSLLSELGIKPE